MSALLLRGGRIINPASGFDQVTDLLLVDGVVAAIGDQLQAKLTAEVESVDVTGKVVVPGLIDIHVHFREPGQTKKEDILTGSQCAARGGFTTVVCMPNTKPAIDNAGTVALIQERAKNASVRIEIAGALTAGRNGKELSSIGSLFRAGVVALTDDGDCIQSNEVMRVVCEYARMFGLPIMDHCQDYDLVGKGVMHEGYWSSVLGLQGWPAAGEEVIVARNILLAEQTRTPIHCQHISSAGSIQLLREARKRGVPISGEACPHHFTLTDASIAGSGEYWKSDGKEQGSRYFGGGGLPSWPCYHTHFKMNPPLRSADDREAILQGLVDGTLEIIASDHAPHTESEKEVEFDDAPFGILGLEVELALSLMALYHTGRLSLPDLLAKFTCNPARFLRLKDGRGELKVGGPADVTVIDLEKGWTSSRSETASKSRNNPFHGWKMQGAAVLTIVRGAIVWRDL
jgi:dihydroorotase